MVAADTERERESAYVSRKLMWRTPLVPSSSCLLKFRYDSWQFSSKNFISHFVSEFR